MIKRIVLRDVASYDHEGVTFDNLSKVNFIYGGNGTGKTTFSRVLAHPNDFPSCKVEWEGKPVEVVVFNQDFKRDNLKEVMPGVFTIGFEHYKETPHAWFLGKKIGRLEEKAGDETAMAELERLKNEREEILSKIMSLQPTVDNINKMLQQMGFTGFSIQPSVKDAAGYQIQREDGSLVEDSLSEGEKTIIAFLYFIQLLFDGRSINNNTVGKLVVIDDPVCSLDADSMFVVSELVWRIQDCARNQKTPRWRVPVWELYWKKERMGMRLSLPISGIVQVFVLTHNVYFYKQITERQQYADTHYWQLSKQNSVSKAKAYGEDNPIRSEYELLWREVRKVKDGETVVGLPNLMRRIIESYFVVMGGYNKRTLVSEHFSDNPDELAIVNSLAKWSDEGSHGAMDEVFAGDRKTINDKYLHVFEMLFKKLGHEAHYNMMMREE